MPHTQHSKKRLVLAQAVSGLLFAVFASLHLVNVMVSSLGPGTYNGFQRAVRPFYQNPVVELAVIAIPLLVHIACGVIQARRRRRRGGSRRAPGLRLRLHRYSGYFLAVVVFGHIAATRGIMLVFGVPPEFGGVAFAMAWMPGVFYPYYILLGLCGLYHTIYGSVIALRLLGLRVPAGALKGPRFWVPLTLAASIVLAGILSFAGWLYPIADPSDNDYARVYIETLEMAEAPGK